MEWLRKIKVVPTIHHLSIPPHPLLAPRHPATVWQQIFPRRPESQSNLIKPCGFTLVGEPWRRMGRPLKDLEGFNIACKILDLDTCTGYWKYASKKPGIPTHHCNMFQTLLLGGSTALLDTPNKIFCVERMKLANIEPLVVHRIILQSWAFHPKFLNLYWVWLKEIKKKKVLVHTRLRSDQGFVASPFPAAP